MSSKTECSVHVFTDIVRYLEQIPSLAAAYVFGSAARGTMKQTSDIDIALLFSNATTIPDRLHLMVDLSRIAERNVDVIIMNDASPMLYHEIISTGKLIFEKDKLFRIVREVKNYKMYADYQHIHSIYMKVMRSQYG